MKQNFAFISYNHRDVKHAQWLQKKLESYKLPAEIHNEFEDTRYLRPVFRDQTDLNTGILANTLRDQLEASKFLIVLCSPNSAKSEWVSKEVESFIKWGRLDCIIPLIVDGQPNCYNPDLECFPAYLRQYTKEHPEDELLGISFSEVGKEKAFIRVVSRMLDVSFDTLWQRHERERRRRIALWCTLTPVVLALMYWLMVPVRLTIDLHDAPHHLPVERNDQGHVGLLTIGDTEYALTSLDTTLTTTPMPGYRRLTDLSVRFEAPHYYEAVQTVAHLGAGLANQTSITLTRDDSFAHLSGRVLDFVTRQPVAGARVITDRGAFEALTDEAGHFDLVYTLDQQREARPLRIECEGYTPFDSDEETVDVDVTYTLRPLK